MSGPSHPTWPQDLLRYAVMLVMIWLTVQGLAEYFPPTGEVNIDARTTYLPNAQKLLANPIGFLLRDPTSYHVAPLGYAWPALWRANPLSIQLANCLLFALSLMMIWRVCMQLGGLWAAGTCVTLMATHMGLIQHIPHILTEAPYFFGWTLSVFAAVQALIQPQHRMRWLCLMAFGLTITLLTRPVLQFICMALLVLCVVARSWTNRWVSRQVAGQVAVALVLALALPMAVTLKNGVFFGVWGIGTGSGTGLLYGTSPTRQGAEPVFSSLSYHAEVVPKFVTDNADVGPLTKEADAINRQVSMALLRQTTWSDNLVFMANKAKMWLFTATPELYVTPNWRWKRLSLWLLILAAGVALACQWRRGVPTPLPGATELSNRQKIAACVALLLGCLGLALQLTPVLYNTRYASYFVDPWLMLLAGLAVAYIVHSRPTRHIATTWLLRVLLLALPVLAAHALAQHALRREVWAMDPHRPGPTQVVVRASAMGQPTGKGMVAIGKQQWRLTAPDAELLVPIDASGLNIAHHADPLWRLQLALQLPQGQDQSSNCGKALLSVSPHHAEIEPTFMPSQLFVPGDGQTRWYMSSATGARFPQGQATISLRLRCPAGSVLTWHGIELRHSSLSQAAKDFLKAGTPIEPYLSEALN